MFLLVRMPTISFSVRFEALLAWVLFITVMDAGEQEPQEVDWGDWSGRVRSISMHRDYNDVGLEDGTNTAVGLHLLYQSGSYGIFKGGLTYDHVEELHRSGNSSINLNNDIRLLTEGWLRADLTDTWQMTIGRQMINGQIFREDTFRHKFRAVEAVEVGYDDGTGFSFTVGHAIRLSNWMQYRNCAEFNSFEDVFGMSEKSRGMTWAEVIHSGMGDWQMALFGAHVHEIAGLMGGVPVGNGPKIPHGRFSTDGKRVMEAHPQGRMPLESSGTGRLGTCRWRWVLSLSAAANCCSMRSPQASTILLAR